jgi:MinD superfamily P-loop ATPase
VDPDLCTGCGECAVKCQMDAVTVHEGKAGVQKHRCIGCGVCAYHCPFEAMRLVSREDFVEPPKSFKELITKQAAAKTKG